MTATLNSPNLISRRSGGSVYRLTWSSTESAPTYDLYELTGGGLVYHGMAETITVTVKNGESPIYWVTDSAASPPAGYPGKIKLQWRRSAGVSYYRIDEQVSGSWTRRAKIFEEGKWIYHWATRWLEDAADHNFRVVAVGTDGNESTAASIAVLMVRWPDVPQVSYSYAGGVVTISEG